MINTITELDQDFYEDQDEIVSVPDTNLSIALHRRDDRIISQESSIIDKFLQAYLVSLV